MNEPTKAQIKEFWEWCGFKKNTFGGYEWTDGSWGFGELPRLDLNNLFKYAVPKVNDENYVEIGSCSGGWRARIVSLQRRVDIGYATNEDLALALFWAIYQVIKEEKNGQS